MYNPRQNLIYQKLQGVFNKYDLMYMRELGAPEDEYHPEIDLIIPFISNKNTKELTELMSAVFNKMFYSGCISDRDNEIIKLSEEINSTLQTTSFDEKYWQDFYWFNKEFSFYIKETTPERFIEELDRLTGLCTNSKTLRGNCFIRHNNMLLQFDLLRKSTELNDNILFEQFTKTVSGYKKQVQLKF